MPTDEDEAPADEDDELSFCSSISVDFPSHTEGVVEDDFGISEENRFDLSLEGILPAMQDLGNRLTGRCVKGERLSKVSSAPP